MGYIKEPEGVDFIIKSDPLTNEARREISEFIQNYKKQAIVKKGNSVKTPGRQKKQVRI